jgi:hypothetical protein
MSQAVADRVRGLRCVVVNTTFRLAPWADVLYAADAAWWRTTPEAFGFPGLKVTCEAVPGVRRLRNAGATGYDDGADCVNTYGNSGAQAIQVAAKAGAKRILLCGFDMRGSHWHGDHPQPLRNTASDTYERWILRMQGLAEALDKRGVEVLNATPESALTCFPFVDLEDAIARPVPAA